MKSPFPGGSRSSQKYWPPQSKTDNFICTDGVHLREIQLRATDPCVIFFFVYVNRQTTKSLKKDIFISDQERKIQTLNSSLNKYFPSFAKLRTYAWKFSTAMALAVRLLVVCMKKKTILIYCKSSNKRPL